MIDKILKWVIIIAMLTVDIIAGAIIYAGLFVLPIYLGVITISLCAGIIIGKYL